MNNRLLAFGAIMYDAWWIFALALALSSGIGVALQSLHPVWLAWVLGMAAALAGGYAAGRAMVAWHARREARRILTMRVVITEADWQSIKGGGDE